MYLRFVIHTSEIDTITFSKKVKQIGKIITLDTEIFTENYLLIINLNL